MEKNTIAEDACEMIRWQEHMCVRGHSHFDLDGSLSFTRGEVTRCLHSRRGTKQTNSDLFTSEIAAAFVALPFYLRDNAARPRDPSHFRLADEMAQQ